MCDSSDEDLEGFFPYPEGIPNPDDHLQCNPNWKKRRFDIQSIDESSSDDDLHISVNKKPKRSLSSKQQSECSALSPQHSDDNLNSSSSVSLSCLLPSPVSVINPCESDFETSTTSSCLSPLNAQSCEWVSEFNGCSCEGRIGLLTALVQHCSHRELVHLQGVLQPFLKKDFISQLPPEIGLKVLTCLSPKDLLTCAKVCRRWRKLSEDELLWRSKCHAEGIISCSAFSDESKTQSLSKNASDSPASTSSHIDAGCSNSEVQLSPEEVNWKKSYLSRRQLKCNWRKGTNRSPLVLKGHQNHVITCLEFYKKKVISASDDATIKIWCLETGLCVNTLYGHIGGVWSSVMVGDLLVSGSTDRSVRVWNLDKGTCVAALFGHISTVRCLASSGRQLVSGSRDTSLRVWDVDTAKCLHVLQGHRAAVRCVQFVGRRVVSGSYDYTVRVWDADTAECIHVLSGHLNRVYTLVFDGEWIASGSLDTTIRVWNVNSGQHVQTLYGHESLTSGMELVKHLLVSSNADATVRIWDIHTGQCSHILAGPNKHSSAVTCVQVTDDFIISASDDGTVKLWDLATGAFLRNLIRLDSGGNGGVVWRILASQTRLVCAAGSRNGAEDTKLVVIDFEGEAAPTIFSQSSVTNREDPPSQQMLKSNNVSHVCQIKRPLGQTLSDLLKDD